MPIDPILAPLLATFVDEAEEVSASVGRALVRLETEQDPPARAELRASVERHLHSLKGTAATMGLGELSELAHAMEDEFAPTLERHEELRAGVADAILFGLDAFVVRLRIHAAGSEPEEPIAASIQSMQHKASSDADPGEIDEPLEARAAGWRVQPRDIDELVREIDRLRQLSFRLERRMAELDAVERGLSGPALRPVRAALSDLRRRVGADREETAALVLSLEERIKAICTLPVRTITDPLHRIVRDLARQTSKRVKLSVLGADIAVDRRRLEALRNPLLHLVRNAVDHGIEAPLVREQLGKHAEGAVVVRVELRGNLLSIEVSDDGAGIDVTRVREEALRLGIATEAQLARATTQETLDLVFRAGLSTRRAVSQTSGRGVGLDVVRAELASMRGHLDVQSTASQGSRFLLTVASELGSAAALVVRAGDHRLALPLLSIEAVTRFEPTKSGDRPAIEHQGRRLDVVDLGALLGVRDARRPSRGDPLVVIAPLGRPVALLVDEIGSQVDVMIHPLPAELAAIPAYQGAANAESGELLLVLRPEWLGSGSPSRAAKGVRRALVVDDSLTARALHRTVLESAGFRVHTASSAEQALDHMQRSTYDVAVCDVSMAPMDGIELCEAIRRMPDGASMPVLLVSALEDDEVRRRALSAGASAFLTKGDCASGRLLATIETVAGSARAP